MKRVLVAVRSEKVSHIQRGLSPWFALRFVTELHHAASALDDEFDLIACGVHFGDGQIYDLLRLAKSIPRTAQIPFVCVHGSGPRMTPAIREAISYATLSLGANALIEAESWIEEFGPKRAYEKVRDSFNALINETAAERRD